MENMIGRALKLIRSYHNLTLDQLNERIGHSKSFISEVERGNKTPSLETLRKYSEAFDMPLSHILFFAENQSEGPRVKKLRRSIAGKAVKMLEWVEEVI